MDMKLLRVSSLGFEFRVLIYFEVQIKSVTSLQLQAIATSQQPNWGCEFAGAFSWPFAMSTIGNRQSAIGNSQRQLAIANAGMLPS